MIKSSHSSRSVTRAEAKATSAQTALKDGTQQAKPVPNAGAQQAEPIPDAGAQQAEPIPNAAADACAPDGTNPDLTELVLIVDRSGSMCGLESDTIGGINAVLTKNRELPGECIVSTVLFDNETSVLHDRIPIAQVKPLTTKDYQVRGCTALLDAVGGAIRHIARVQGYMPAGHKAGHVIFVITTDGFENASRRYSYPDVKQMISAQQELGWEFMFLGANIDAAAEACKIGIAEDRAATYVADAQGTQVMYGAVAESACKMRSAPVGCRVGGQWRDAVERDRKSRKK